MEDEREHPVQPHDDLTRFKGDLERTLQALKDVGRTLKDRGVQEERCALTGEELRLAEEALARAQEEHAAKKAECDSQEQEADAVSQRLQESEHALRYEIERLLAANNLLLRSSPLGQEFCREVTYYIDSLQVPSEDMRRVLDRLHISLASLLPFVGGGEEVAERVPLLSKAVHVPPTHREWEEKARLKTHIRWLITLDVPEVLRIEQGSFEYSWIEEDFLRCLRQQNCIGMVAEASDETIEARAYEIWEENGRPERKDLEHWQQAESELRNKILGFMVYELHKRKIHILNFAVHPSWRHRGVGVQMVEKLKSKLSPDRRIRLTLDVRETNVAAQKFFGLQSFKALTVLPQYYEDSGEDAFLMEYRVDGAPAVDDGADPEEGGEQQWE